MRSALRAIWLAALAIVIAGLDIYAVYSYDLSFAVTRSILQTAEAVDEVHARLLQLQPGAPVIVVERIALGYDRQPLEWRRSRGPADQFRYHVEIR